MAMSAKIAVPNSLAGSLLVAMPQMSDPRFERAVIFMCAHNEEGAMGLVINKLFEQLSFGDLLDQLEIPSGPRTQQIRVHAGGPVEAGRGFVLHSDDYLREGTMPVDSGFALTATTDILRAIATTDAKRRPALVVGFAAETENVVAHAQKKLVAKGCDWILANDVSEGTHTFGGDSNAVHLVTANAVEDWPRMSKPEVAARLAERIAAAFSETSSKKNAKKGS